MILYTQGPNPASVGKYTSVQALNSWEVAATRQNIMTDLRQSMKTNGSYQFGANCSETGMHHDACPPFQIMIEMEHERVHCLFMFVKCSWTISASSHPPHCQGESLKALRALRYDHLPVKSACSLQRPASGSICCPRASRFLHLAWPWSEVGPTACTRPGAFTSPRAPSRWLNRLLCLCVHSYSRSER